MVFQDILHIAYPIYIDNHHIQYIRCAHDDDIIINQQYLKGDQLYFYIDFAAHKPYSIQKHISFYYTHIPFTITERFMKNVKYICNQITYDRFFTLMNSIPQSWRAKIIMILEKGLWITLGYTIHNTSNIFRV